MALLSEKRTHAGRGRLSAAGGGKIQPPLTPMIDVTFLLLLYFILTANVSPEEGNIPGTLPRQSGVAAEQEVPLKPIRVNVSPLGSQRQDAQYAIAGEGVSLESPQELYSRLLGRRDALGTDEIPIIIDPMGDVRWKFVLEAYNQAVRAKYKNVGFAPPGG
ncbi:MAG: ExbD/TolR family protein [Phycisphaerae bacterium]